jgi:uncharacterized membrane protein YhaH (DUF805 family)
MPSPVHIVGFLNQNLGWLLLGAVLIALVGLISLASRRAREQGISSRIFVVAVIAAAGPLAALGLAMITLSLMSSPAA